MLSSSLRWKKKSKFSAKQAIILLLLIIVAIVPLAFQKEQGYSKLESHRTLTVITSHNETIRSEITRAFSDWYFDKYDGIKVHINWVTPGGGAEVRKVIDTRFANFEKHKGKPGAENVGLDVYFGGGEYEFELAKRKGYLEKLDAFKAKGLRGSFLRPAGGTASIRKSFTGEKYYDDEDFEWVGVCLSTFGIVYNTDVLKRLGYTEDEYPTTWDDLADPRLFKNIALADPTKSGSVTKAFEMVLQQKMQEHIAVNKTPRAGESAERHRQRILNEGWDKGMRLIQKICANSRYFSDSASKIPHDVANGDAAVGMCIDFYGRTYNSKHMKEDGSSRVQFVIPKNGTTLSADPVAVFKHAASPDVAQDFVKFLLGPNGQPLWNGDPKYSKKWSNLPKKRALRRLPISEDYYSEKYTKHATDPDIKPYTRTDLLTYDRSLTGKTFNALRTIIRVMAIDTHDELAAAWKEMIEAKKRVDADPDNLEKRKIYADIMDDHFHGLSKVSYTKAVSDISEKISKMRRKRTLSARFRDLKKANFSKEKMKQYYPELSPEKYSEEIEKLRSEVETLEAYDIMTLEKQQYDLASQFRASYSKAIANARKFIN